MSFLIPFRSNGSWKSRSTEVKSNAKFDLRVSKRDDAAHKLLSRSIDNNTWANVSAVRCG
jgi:hypothetical protein